MGKKRQIVASRRLERQQHIARDTVSEGPQCLVTSSWRWRERRHLSRSCCTRPQLFSLLWRASGGPATKVLAGLAAVPDSQPGELTCGVLLIAGWAPR